MTIDEAIAKYKEITNTDANCPAHCNISCDKCVQESKQLSEWLEELKKRRNEDYGYLADIHQNIGYRKAIDDFAENIRTYYSLKQEMGYVATTYEDLINYIFELAEQLKVGGGEYNDGWIPCSERLPEESGYYLVTYHNWSDGNFLPKYDDTYVRRLHYQISDHFVGWNYPKNVDDRAENDCHKEVIAWQPLPKPFKERE